MHPVGARDGLHQGMRFERLIEVNRGQARHIKAGHPHRADNGDAERVCFRFEGLVQFHPLHVAELRFVAHGLGQVHAFFDKSAVRPDVQIPLAKLFHLALLFAHHHRHAGFTHPVNLTLKVVLFLLVTQPRLLGLQCLDMLIPVKFNQPVHTHAGYFVYADQHRLAALPGRRVMLHEVLRHLIEPLAGGDNVVLALQFSFQPLFHIEVIGFNLFQFLRHPLVQIADGNAQFVAASVIVKRSRNLVFHRLLEAVDGNIVAEDLPRNLIIAEQRCAGEADVTGVRQGISHVQRQNSILRSMRFVGDDDDVVSLSVTFCRVRIELLNQRKYVRLMLTEQAAQVCATRSATICVFIYHAATGKGFIDLIVQVAAVG